MSSVQSDLETHCMYICMLFRYIPQKIYKGSVNLIRATNTPHKESQLGADYSLSEVIRYFGNSVPFCKNIMKPLINQM